MCFRLLVPVIGWLAAITGGAGLPAVDCRSLRDLQLADTMVSVAQSCPADRSTAPGALDPVDLCRVLGNVKAAGPSSINFAVWLPASNWAARYAHVGMPMLASARTAQDPVAVQDDRGGAHSKRRDYRTAEAVHREALRAAETVLGPDHVEGARVLTALAEVLYEQERHSEAEPLCRRALAIRERLLGDAHPDVAYSLNNLAEIYRATNRYVAAEPLYRRALRILETYFNREHASVAATLNNLAALYTELGRFDRALPLYQRSLRIAEMAAGPDSHAAAAVLNNLAVAYLGLNRRRDAAAAARRSLAIEHSDAARATLKQILGNERGKR